MRNLKYKLDFSVAILLWMMDGLGVSRMGIAFVKNNNNNNKDKTVEEL